MLGSFSRPVSFPFLAASAAVIVSQLTAFLREGTAKMTTAFGRLEGGWRGRGLFSPFLSYTQRCHTFCHPPDPEPRLLEGRFHLRGSPTSSVDDSAGETSQNRRFFFPRVGGIFALPVDVRLEGKSVIVAPFFSSSRNKRTIVFLSVTPQCVMLPCEQEPGANLSVLRPAGVGFLSVLAALTS